MTVGDAAVGEIAALCGYLPLAIGMMGRQLGHHPAWTAAGLAAELAAARDRLELMAAENLSVAAAFGLSYHDLDDGQQRLFRRWASTPARTSTPVPPPRWMTSLRTRAAAAWRPCMTST